MQEKEPCIDCQERCVGCHGKDEDGNWRCPRWGAKQERLAEEREKSRGARIGAAITKSYVRESIRRMDIKKGSGHLKR